LIVLDFSMPDLNGFEIATQIFKTCPALPIVLRTFHIHPEMNAAAKRIGIREVVDKGNVGTSLPEVIETILKGNPSAAASALTISPQAELTDAESANDKGRHPEPN
jgi:DNA-binding NarL/FixJ family response regulator